MPHPRARSSSGPADINLPYAGWRDALRWPELAGSTPNRRAVHRALRLGIAAGTVAAGSCLVLGIVVLILTLTIDTTGVARTASNRPIATSQSGNSGGGHGKPWPPVSAIGSRAWIAGPTIASFHGTGSARHGNIRIGNPGTWGLSWTFSCLPGRSANFLHIATTTATGDDVEIEASGPTGRGITWNARDVGYHSLDINSDCSWSVRVVLPRTASRSAEAPLTRPEPQPLASTPSSEKIDSPWMSAQFVIQRSRCVTNVGRWEGLVRHYRTRRSVLGERPPRLLRSGGSHAGPPGQAAARDDPWRSPLRRRLRLIGAVGTAAGGMCLVLAMVALVATMTGTGVPRRASSSVSGHPSSHPGQPSHRPESQAGHLLVGRTLAVYRGAGARKRSSFQLTRRGAWGISWGFTCPASHHGTFLMTEGGPGEKQDDQVDARGPAGHGVFWDTSDPGGHTLVVSSDCPWTVRVVLPRLIARHQAAGLHPRNGMGEDQRRKARAARPEAAGDPGKPDSRKTRGHPKKPGRPRVRNA